MTYVNGIYRDEEHQRLAREAAYLRLKAAQAQVEIELYLLEADAKQVRKVCRHDKERDAVISGMRKEGKTQREIAEALGIQQKSVARACKRMGV